MSNFKWIPIENKEQWPNKMDKCLFLTKYNTHEVGLFQSIHNGSLSIDIVTHFAVIPSLAECEAREKEKEELLSKISAYGFVIADEQDECSLPAGKTSEMYFEEIKSLLNQI